MSDSIDRTQERRNTLYAQEEKRISLRSAAMRIVIEIDPATDEDPENVEEHGPGNDNHSSHESGFDDYDRKQQLRDAGRGHLC